MVFLSFLSKFHTDMFTLAWIFIVPSKWFLMISVTPWPSVRSSLVKTSFGLYQPILVRNGQISMKSGWDILITFMDPIGKTILHFSLFSSLTSLVCHHRSKWKLRKTRNHINLCRFYICERKVEFCLVSVLFAIYSLKFPKKRNCKLR